LMDDMMKCLKRRFMEESRFTDIVKDDARY
jgi:hypothetical protein